MTNHLKCISCKNPFELPLSSHWQRQPCRLPITLNCTHSCCYQCMIESVDQSQICTVHCFLCGTITRRKLVMVKSNPTLYINCYLLGLIQLQKIELHCRTENDQRQELSVPRVEVDKNAQCSASTRAAVCKFEHNYLPLNYWCNEDNKGICSTCKLTDHLGHEIISAQERPSMELKECEKATDAGNKLLYRLQQAIKALDEKHCTVEEGYKTSSIEVQERLNRIHGILQILGMEVQHKLHDTFLERANSLKKIEKTLRGVMDGVNKELSDLQEPFTSQIVQRCSQLVNKLQDYLPALDSLSALPEMSCSFAIDSHLEPIRILTESPPMVTFTERGDLHKKLPAFESLLRELESKRKLDRETTTEEPPRKIRLKADHLPATVPDTNLHSPENLSKIEVTLSYIMSPEDFHVRVISLPPALTKSIAPVPTKRTTFEVPSMSFETLSQELNSHYRCAPRTPGVAFPVGAICVVEHKSDFKRCEVLKETEIQLIDVGEKIEGIDESQLINLEDRWNVDKIPPMAIRCALWGIHVKHSAPKDDAVKKASYKEAKDSMKKASYKKAKDSMEEIMKDAKTFFARDYQCDGKTRKVRLYCESGRPGEIRTICVNDLLLEKGVVCQARLSHCKVSVEPPEWPPCLTLPQNLEAECVWFDKHEMLYVHHTKSQYHRLLKIQELLNWLYAKLSKKEEEERKAGKPPKEEVKWEAGQLCVSKCVNEEKWYRGQVLAVDDERKLAKIVYVDYGNEQVDVPFKNMHKALICTEYPIQAYKIRIEKYPTTSPPTDPEIQMFRNSLINTTLRFSLNYSDDIPLATKLELVDGSVNSLPGTQHI